MFRSLTRSIPAVLCTASLLAIVGCDTQSDSEATAEPVSDTSTEAAENTESSADAEKSADVQVDRSTADRSPASMTTASSSARAEPQEGEIVVIAEPERLDLGTMGTGEQKTGIITLRNTGDEPREIINSRTSCGCTVANVPKGEMLQPGDTVDVEVSLSGGSRAQHLSKTVTFIIQDQQPLVVRVQSDVVAYVSLDPPIVNPEEMVDDTLTIRSEDGQAFSVTRMNPDVAVELPQEAATEHSIQIDWDRWEQQGQPRRLLFHLDHPETSRLSASVRVPANSTRSTSPNAREISTAARRPAELIERGETEAFLERMHEEDFDINATDRRDTTLLSIAAKEGQYDIMKALIEAGADIEATDRVGRTPLMHAAQSKNAATVRLLIESGADVDRRDTTLGNTALSWAAGFGDSGSVRELLDAGARVEIVSTVTGFTPLILAAGFGEAESVTLLVEAGAEIEAVDTVQTFTPVMYAASTGEVENLRALIDAGADIEATDPNGRTTLLVAAANSGANAQTVQALIDAGAKVDATDSSDKNALDLARERTDPRRAQIIAVLEPLLGDGDE